MLRKDYNIVEGYNITNEIHIDDQQHIFKSTEYDPSFINFILFSSPCLISDSNDNTY